MEKVLKKIIWWIVAQVSYELVFIPYKLGMYPVSLRMAHACIVMQGWFYQHVGVWDKE